eukprot:9143807-Pyramimonas_sp.AAC.2
MTVSSPTAGTLENTQEAATARWRFPTVCFWPVRTVDRPAMHFGLPPVGMDHRTASTTKGPWITRALSEQHPCVNDQAISAPKPKFERHRRFAALQRA